MAVTQNTGCVTFVKVSILLCHHAVSCAEFLCFGVDAVITIQTCSMHHRRRTTCSPANLFESAKKQVLLVL